MNFPYNVKELSIDYELLWPIQQDVVFKVVRMC
jgi:hypothetical protein